MNDARYPRSRQYGFPVVMDFTMDFLLLWISCCYGFPVVGRLQQIMFCKLCKRTYDVFTHLCSKDYTDQITQCVIRNASPSIMLLTTHKHDSEIINKSDETKTCATCGENKFPLRGRCEGFTFPTNDARYPRSRQ